MCDACSLTARVDVHRVEHRERVFILREPIWLQLRYCPVAVEKPWTWVSRPSALEFLTHGAQEIEGAGRTGMEAAKDFAEDFATLYDPTDPEPPSEQRLREAVRALVVRVEQT